MIIEARGGEYKSAEVTARGQTPRRRTLRQWPSVFSDCRFESGPRASLTLSQRGGARRGSPPSHWERQDAPYICGHVVRCAMGGEGTATCRLSTPSTRWLDNQAGGRWRFDAARFVRRTHTHTVKGDGLSPLFEGRD